MKNFLSSISFNKLTLFVCGIMAFSFSSCIDEKEDVTPEPVAYASFYHGSPNATDLNIKLDGTQINNQGFKYANFSGYLALKVGERKVAFTPLTSTDALAETTYNFKKDNIYSVYAVNRTENFEILVVKDSLLAPTAGNAAVRVINLSPDAPAVDVSVAGVAAPLFTDIAFKEASSFKPVQAGTLSVRVNATGTTDSVMPVTNLVLDAGRNYTLVVRGFETPPAQNSNVLTLQLIRNY